MGIRSPSRSLPHPRSGEYHPHHLHRQQDLRRLLRKRMVVEPPPQRLHQSSELDLSREEHPPQVKLDSVGEERGRRRFKGSSGGGRRTLPDDPQYPIRLRWRTRSNEQSSEIPLVEEQSFPFLLSEIEFPFLSLFHFAERTESIVMQLETARASRQAAKRLLSFELFDLATKPPSPSSHHFPPHT
jgi:hypothetical protein